MLYYVRLRRLIFLEIRLGSEGFRIWGWVARFASEVAAHHPETDSVTHRPTRNVDNGAHLIDRAPRFAPGFAQPSIYAFAVKHVPQSAQGFKRSRLHKQQAKAPFPPESLGPRGMQGRVRILAPTSMFSRPGNTADRPAAVDFPLSGQTLQRKSCHELGQS